MEAPISDFRGGLDARKYRLALPPGTLTDLVNAHITAGGEIEKRKAFGLLSNSSGAVATSLSPGVTFGLQETATGLVVFGSGAATTYPAGVTYQLLQHPAVLAGTVYDATKHAMTAVIDSKLFGDFIFVTVAFADGYQFAYYNGMLVPDFIAGLVLPYLNTNPKLAAAIVALVNNTANYTALQDASPNDNEFDVFSLPGNSYSSTVTVASLCNITVATDSDTGFTSAAVTATDGTNAGNGSTINIGGKLYTFQTTLTNVNGNVLIGGTIAETLTNLFAAINLGSGSGTTYAAAMTLNANVYAQFLVTAGTPNFQVAARVANLQGEVANVIPAMTYELDADTVTRQTPLPAQGQFKVVAVNPYIPGGGRIISTGSQPADGSTIRVRNGSAHLAPNLNVYRFKTTMTTAYDVKIGATANDTFDNLILAINGTGVAGTNYFAGTVVSAYITAAARTGSGANSYSVITSLTALQIWLTYSFTSAFTGTTVLPQSANPTSAISSILVGPVFASGTITTNGTNPANNNTVVIGTTTYTFKTALTPATGEIKIGANANTTMQNLIEAINQTGVYGVDYGVTARNPDVSALPSLTNGILRLITLVAGAAGNTLSLAVTGSTLTLSGAFLTGGSDAVELLAATVTPVGGNVYSFCNAVATAINANSSVSGYKATVGGSTIYIRSVATNSLSNLADITVTVTGAVAIGQCAFQLSMTTGFATTTDGIKSVQVNGVAITSGTGFTLAGSGTIEALCVNIAANASVATAGFTMVPQGNRIYLAKLVTSSLDNPLDVAVQLNSATNSNLGVSEVAGDGLTALISPNNVPFLRVPVKGTSNNSIAANFKPAQLDPVLLGISLFGNNQNMKTAEESPIIVTCKPAGGFPPYRYQWQYVSGDNGFVANNDNSPNTTFRRKDSNGVHKALWACVVTDSTGASVQSNTVELKQP